MANELANSLLGLQGAGPNQLAMLAADPNLATQIPQLTLAQAMQQQGLSGAPAYPAQALGRLGQALAGTFLQHQATDAIAKSTAGAVEAAKSIYGEDTIPGKALRSGVPLLQMQVLQGIPKDMLLAQGQRYEAGAAYPKAAAQQRAETEAAGPKAGAEAAAKAKVEYGDMLNPQPTAGAPGLAPAAAPQGGASAPPNAAPAASAPGQTVIPPVKDQAPLPNAPKAIDQKLPAWQKTQDEWNASLVPGYQAEQRLATIAGAFKAIQTGSFTTDKADWAAKLKGVGLGGVADRIMKDPAQAQLALHENYVETLQQLKAASPRFTQMEFRMLSENKEHPNLQPEANLQMLSEDIGQIRHQRALVNSWPQAQKTGWRDPQSYESSWLTHNKLSDFVKGAKDEIGPLKGMKSEKGAAFTPPAGAPMAIGPNGHRITIVNGAWVDATTGKPLQ